MTKFPSLLMHIAMIFLLGNVACSQSLDGTSKAVEFKLVREDTYQSFLKNWDGGKSAVLLAFVNSLDQFNTIFQPAALNGRNGKFSPDDQEFETSSFLAIGRIIRGSKKGTEVFEIQSMEQDKTKLTVRYKFTKPIQASSYDSKAYLLVRINKVDVDVVEFIENDKNVGQLQIDSDNWVLPKPVADE